MSGQELKPCPRGHKAKISQGSFGTFIVTCIEPDCPWGLNDEYKTTDEALESWNTRHDAPRDKGLTVEQIESLVRTQTRIHELMISEQQIEDMVEAIHAALPTESEKDARINICPTCEGISPTQYDYQGDDKWSPCPECDGTGFIGPNDKQIIESMTAQIKEMREALAQINHRACEQCIIDLSCDILAKYSEAK